MLLNGPADLPAPAAAVQAAGGGPGRTASVSVMPSAATESTAPPHQQASPESRAVPASGRLHVGADDTHCRIASTAGRPPPSYPA